LHTAVELVRADITAASNDAPKSFVVLAGRSRRLAVENLSAELRSLVAEVGSQIGSSVPKTLGDVSAALVAANVDASLLVLQAAAASAH
jgi:hypothetical protein